MKRPKILSATFVKTISTPGRYGDGRGGHGLSLLVKPMTNGRISKSWAQRLRVNDKPVNIGLGSYPLISLAEAREKALENRQALLRGIDPRGTIPTFAEAAEIVIGIHAGGWRDDKSENQWRASLENYVMPKIGNKRVNEITTADVMAILLPHWQSKQVTMSRVRNRISKIMKWSIAKGLRQDNPAGEALTAALPKNGHKKNHHTALPFSEVGAALANIRQSGAYPTTKLAFEFLILCAARSGESRLSKWHEIDFGNATWTIPASRMKTKREHRVPLSKEAIKVLEEAMQYADSSGYIFPSPSGKAVSGDTFSKLSRENNIGAVPHGFRASFRNWAAECTDAPREICEMCLAHVEGSAAELAYRRTDYFERRRELMQDWADYVRT